MQRLFICTLLLCPFLLHCVPTVPLNKQEFQSWWCPGQCANITLKTLCDRNYLFIISTGRSGSTTLLKSLKMIQGIGIIGETNILPELENMFDSAVAIRSNRGLFADEYAILARLQRIYNILLGDDVNSLQTQAPYFFGSKEVHVPADTLPFIRRLFPCSRFIVNVRRNVQKQAQSAFHKLAGATPKELRRETASLLRAKERMPLISYTVALEDFGARAFDDVIRWLGYRGCHYDVIGHYNYNGSYSSAGVASISGECVHRYTIT